MSTFAWPFVPENCGICGKEVTEKDVFVLGKHGELYHVECAGDRPLRKDDRSWHPGHKQR